MEESLRSTLSEGARRLGAVLSPRQVEEFETYLALLQKWGSKINLTSRRSPEEVIVYHFLDSLAPLALIPPGAAGQLVDIGTGAGFPGLPLKIVRTGLWLSLVESSHKKMSFCREVARALGLQKVEFLQKRVEDLSRDRKYHGLFDWVVTRAFGNALTSFELSRPFLSPRGTLILYKGSPDREEIDALSAGAARQGLSVSLLPVEIPFLEARRILLVVGPTS